MLKKWNPSHIILPNWICAAAAGILILYGAVSTDIYIRQVLSMIGINYILAAGLNLLFGHTGQISIGQAGFYALGAYTASILETKLSVPFFAAWPAAVILTGGIAFLLGQRILKLHGHYLAMATIAFGMIIESLSTNWIAVTNGHAGVYVRSKSLLGDFLSSNLFALVVLFAALAFIISNNIEYSRVGRAIRAVRENEDAATSVGIVHSKYKVIMFILGAAFSAVGGMMYAHLNGIITPEVFNLAQSQTILIIVVVGGIGSNIGVLLGAIVITTLPEFLYGFADYNILVYGLLVILMQLFCPSGLIGIAESLGRLLKKTAGRRTPPKAAGGK